MDQPKTYTRNNGLQKTDNLFVLDTFFRLIKWKSDEDTVLDVGVGDGAFAVEDLVPRFPKKIGKFVGCDISENMVEFAKKNYKRPGADFVRLDIGCENVPVEFVENFDHIFSFYTLHWVQNQRQAFFNISRMLKPGGDMLVCFLARNPIFEIYRNMLKNSKWAKYTKQEFIAPYQGCEDPVKEVEQILVESGLTSHVCRVEKRTYYFPNLEIWRKSMVAVNAIIPRLPPGEVPNYIEDYKNEMKKLDSITIEPLDNGDEKIHMEYELLIVFASKPLETDNEK